MLTSKICCFHFDSPICFTGKRREIVEMLENFILENIGASNYHVIAFVVSCIIVMFIETCNHLWAPILYDTIETTIANNSNWAIVTRTMEVPLNAFTEHFIFKWEMHQQQQPKHNIENHLRTTNDTVAKCAKLKII